MKISALVKIVSAATVGFANAKFTRGSLYKTEESEKRHLDSTELSMPGQMKDFAGDSAGIAELLTENGVNEEGVSGFLMALDISAEKMSSGPARAVCTTIVDEILDFFLLSHEVKEAIKIIICSESEDEESTIIAPTCGGDKKEGDACNYDDDECGCGLRCDPYTSGSACLPCKCVVNGEFLGNCSSNAECGEGITCNNPQFDEGFPQSECPNLSA
eukprot:CAMPEP_0181083522 /NCGR_PEP_ID=MMETSP1071-20121207/4202_1 /TAXON_ID=35127 /ORGANISM="Thalassiosira sp., Strain NH16" /LENGTH=215 /DNA_ID=CAMNT_0023165185 /DNA_START=721 /DNA_END=1368 /DNA_ORIENTATION=+